MSKFTYLFSFICIICIILFFQTEIKRAVSNGLSRSPIFGWCANFTRVRLIPLGVIVPSTVSTSPLQGWIEPLGTILTPNMGGYQEGPIGYQEGPMGYQEGPICVTGNITDLCFKKQCMLQCLGPRIAILGLALGSE